MPDAIGIPEEMLRQAATMAVCKINIDSDLRLACTAAIRKHFNEHPDHFDPRQYLGDARANIKAITSKSAKFSLNNNASFVSVVSNSFRKLDIFFKRMMRTINHN